MSTALIVIGGILIVLGAILTRMARTAPVPIEPVNGIAILLGAVCLLLGLGGWLD